MTQPSPEAFKAAACDQWNRSAIGWDGQREQIGSWLRSATGTMLDLAAVGPGSRVLDVAAGSGGQTLDIAERVGKTGYVLATDLSPRILELAADNARRAGYGNVETKISDGEGLDVGPASFDSAVCRLGLMFVPSPDSGLREMFRALRPGGRACAMVFSSPANNPCVTALVSVALRHAGLPPRDPYQPGGLLSLGKPGLSNELFAAAGFVDVTTTTVSAPFMLPSVKDYLAFISTAAGPILQILERLDEAARAAAWAEIEEELSGFSTPSGWCGPNELLLTAGRK